MSKLTAFEQDQLDETITRLHGIAGTLACVAEQEHTSGNIEHESMFDNLIELVHISIDQLAKVGESHE